MAGLRDEMITVYFGLDMSYRDMVTVLANKHSIMLTERHLKRILCDMNLRRRTFTDFSEIVTFIQNELNGAGALHGYRMMHAKCTNAGLRARKEDVRLILSDLDPQGVATRLSRRLARRSYFASGPNFIWHLDGYDKLKPFGLCINGAIDGFSRKIIWLKVYHTNSDPRLVGGYFLEAITELRGCPRVVRGDFGTENGHVRVFQQFLRRYDTDSMASRCYLEGASTANQRIESWWTFLRKQCTNWWIDLFTILQEQGDFAGDFTDKSLVQFCFTSVMQVELDKTSVMWDSHKIRQSRNGHCPHGRPLVMYTSPSLWGAEEKLCAVTDNDINACMSEATFRSGIPCDVDVFDICSFVMHRDGLDVPVDCIAAVNLYLHLRREIRQLID